MSEKRKVLLGLFGALGILVLLVLGLRAMFKVRDRGIIKYNHELICPQGRDKILGFLSYTGHWQIEHMDGSYQSIPFNSGCTIISKEREPENEKK